jgi:hypothetical protein
MRIKTVTRPKAGFGFTAIRSGIPAMSAADDIVTFGCKSDINEMLNHIP